MTYLGQAAIASNSFMSQRVAQCAVSEGIDDAEMWTSKNRRVWAAAPGWDAAWASALASHENEAEYDPGKDEAVITDGMILSQVQSMQVA